MTGQLRTLRSPKDRDRLIARIGKSSKDLPNPRVHDAIQRTLDEIVRRYGVIEAVDTIGLFGLEGFTIPAEVFPTGVR